MASTDRFYSPDHAGMLFGERYRDAAGRMQTHRGYDVRGFKLGESIPSWCSGRVVREGFDAGYGYFLTVQLTADRWAHWCHMQSASPLTVGAQVTPGMAVGAVGSTGRFAIGAHCHLMVTKGISLTSTAVDPIPYITEALRETQENDMPLDTADKDWVRLAMRQELERLLVVPGQVYQWLPAISNQIGSIAAPNLQPVLDAIAAIDPAAEVDLGELKAAVAALSAKVPTAEAIAEAVADEEAKRLAR